MIHLPLEDILAYLKTEPGQLCQTIDLPFYKEAVIIHYDKNMGNGIGADTTYFCPNTLKTIWNCAIVYPDSKEFAEYCSRYSCKCFWRCTMADQKIVNLTEETCDYSDDSLFNINSWGADLSFRELIMMYDDDELVKPELQRKYVWSKEEASKFIDSLLLGLPVPSIFLAKVADQKLIIDGYQRLMTVYDFVNGIFSGDGKVFKLTNSESINRRWRGKAFSELPKDEQRRIQSTTIHAIIFEQKHPANDSGMYKIFERINTSGRNLKPQEIRNCVYHGELNKLLMFLNTHETWRKLWGSAEGDSRMTDIEFILRFFTLNSLLRNGTDLKQLTLKKELNSFMENNAEVDAKKIEELVEEFVAVMETIWDALGANAFRNLTKPTEKNPTQKFSNSIHPAVFDAVTIATAQFLKNKENGSTDHFTTENYKRLLNNAEFIDCITIRTTNTAKIERRVELARNFLFGM